jgi:hypothetical protein
LSSTELSHIGYDLDADVTATPNYIIGVPRLFRRHRDDSIPEPRTSHRRSLGIKVAYFDSIGARCAACQGASATRGPRRAAAP